MSRILAVDDSETVRREVRAMLEAEGHRVHEASDGHEALAALEAAPFDLVVTDLYMPRLDGLGLARRIRALERYRTTPVLMLTIEDSEEMRCRGHAAGVSSWLVKPCDPAALWRTVRRLLDPGR